MVGIYFDIWANQPPNTLYQCYKLVAGTSQQGNAFVSVCQPLSSAEVFPK